MEDIDAHCEKHKPDIIVIDQLDKVNVSGTYARTDEKLRQIYTNKKAVGRECPAPKQNGECGSCRACWSRERIL